MSTQNFTRVKPRLREQAIDARDLMEVDAKQYNDIKMQGITPANLQKKLKSEPETHSINFDISFIPPKKEFHAKTGVFFPMKNQRYSDLKNNVSTVYQRQPQQISYSTPYQLPVNGGFGSYNNQPIVVSRILQKSDGRILHLPLNNHY